MDEQKETATTETSDGTILKPFLIDGGRFIVEVDISNLEYVLFSIRGEVNCKSIPDVLQTADTFLKQIINDKKYSGND